MDTWLVSEILLLQIVLLCLFLYMCRIQQNYWIIWCEYSIFQGNTKLFQSSLNNLHSCQQCIRNSADPHALQYLHHQTCLFLHKMPVYDFCPFSYCIIYSILCRHSLYIVDISTFSVVCVKIFSQIVSIFFMASFDKQMFLFLI